MRLNFVQQDLAAALALARLVRPENGDLSMRAEGRSLRFFCYDKRRAVVSRIDAGPGDPVPAGDHYFPMDKVQLLESGLESVTLSIGEGSVTIRSEGGGQSRTAVLKSRSKTSRRPPVPSLPEGLQGWSVPRSDFDWSLKQLSCSALVKETKTEDDMRINQVHYYGGRQVAVSSTGYHTTAVRLPGVDVDTSFVSSDVPVIRSFCSKVRGGSVRVSLDDRFTYVSDPDTGSFLALGRISSKRSDPSLPDPDGFSVSFLVPEDVASRSLGWACSAVDGTQRVTFDVRRDGDGGEVTLSSGQEIARFPVRFLAGGSFKSDFPIRYLSLMASSVDGDVLFKFAHKDSPTLLCVSGHPSRQDGLSSEHYVQCMRPR